MLFVEFVLSVVFVVSFVLFVLFVLLVLLVLFVLLFMELQLGGDAPVQYNELYAAVSDAHPHLFINLTVSS